MAKRRKYRRGPPPKPRPRPVNPLGLLPHLADRPVSYAEAAFLLRASLPYLRRLVIQLKLPRVYRRVGSHPRRHAFLPLESIQALKAHFYGP